MIRLILVVIAIVAACAVSVFLTLNPGSISFDFLGLSGRMPFALGLGLSVVHETRTCAQPVKRLISMLL